MSKTSISAKLVNALSRIDRPGTFCTSGSATTVLPGLEVGGVGVIGLPLAKSQLAELEKKCEQAPFGKGKDTIVDTNVRRVWRLTPDHFSLTNPAWADFLNERLAEVQKNLGLEDQKLEAHLYDLLLYEAGSFFLPHQDGEKIDRMVATLVVVLPSKFEGGELVVRHEGQEQVVDFSGPNSPFEIQFAAFYADCEHEVKKLKSGHRLCLIYNLVLSKSKGQLGAPRVSGHIGQIAGLLLDWKKTADGPMKLAVTLDHEYTQDGLEWDALKGADRSKAQVLADAAAQAGFHANLALVTFWESGSIEDYEYGRGGRYGRSRYAEEDHDDDHDYEISELLDSSLTADHWRGAGGEKPAFGAIPFEPEEVAPPKSLKAAKPEQDVNGYMGNEGMTLDRWYRRAAICLWPDENHLDVLCAVGSVAALPSLDRMVKELRQEKGDEASAARAKCIQFAGKILANWPAHEYRQWNRPASNTLDSDPMASLNVLDDESLIREYLGKTLVRDVALEPGKAIAPALARHGWSKFRPQLLTLFAATDTRTIERNVRLLERICNTAAHGISKKSEPAEARETCRLLAEATIAALSKIDTSKEATDWQYERADRAPMLANLIGAFLAVDLDGPLQELFLLVQSLPERYPLREVQLKAFATLGSPLGGHAKPYPAPLSRWIAVTREHLESLTAAIPQPPSDLRREAPVSCKCKDCEELKRFLVDPSRNQAEFRMAKDRRKHLESMIHRACDLDCKTVTTSNPHVLLCTKNMASYQGKLKQYHEDVESLKFVRSLE